MTQAPHEDRVRAVAATLERDAPVGFSRSVALKLAKLVVDAVEAADNAEAERRAEALRKDQERQSDQTWHYLM